MLTTQKRSSTCMRPLIHLVTCGIAAGDVGETLSPIKLFSSDLLSFTAPFKDISFSSASLI